MTEKRSCQNCKQNFTIEDDDFLFYEKIQVPPPTFCPECRMIRRMCWRNHRSLYRRICELCKKNLLAVYADDGVPVMCAECWNGDNWDHFLHAKDINWDDTVFNQIYSLFNKQPRVFQYRAGGNIVNSDYANSVANSKNIYLSFSCLDCEDIQYSENIDNSKNSFDCSVVSGIDQCSWNMDSVENYNCHFMLESQKNIDSYFLFDCHNCKNCCLSSNLRNKTYCFKNQQLSKEQYDVAVQNLSLHTFSGFQKAISEFVDIKNNAVHRYTQIFKSLNAVGDHIRNSKDIYDSFDITNSENIIRSYRIVSSKDIVDCSWVLTGELEYETISGSVNSRQQIGCAVSFSSHDMEYSLFCRNSAYCFGCVGLKNATYCIFNKQYTKDEYEVFTKRLREHMKTHVFTDAQGRTYTYGDFYPFSFSPFGYNETLAHDVFPFTKETALQAGFKWKEREKRDYTITRQGKDLPDSILDVPETITQEIIACPNNGNADFQCTVAYKITSEELQFYRQKKLPLPRKCPNCRHYERLTYRNKLRMYTRNCSSGCGATFETTYAPNRPEKVYCEQCYQKEVL